MIVLIEAPSKAGGPFASIGGVRRTSLAYESSVSAWVVPFSPSFLESSHLTNYPSAQAGRLLFAPLSPPGSVAPGPGFSNLQIYVAKLS